MHKIPLTVLICLLSCITSNLFCTENIPPNITVPEEYHAWADSTFNIPIEVADPNGDSVRVQVSGLPNWMIYDMGTSSIQGKPSSSDLGRFQFIVIADDGKMQSTKLIRLTVTVRLSLQDLLDQKLAEYYKLYTPGLTGVSAALISPEGQLVTSSQGKRDRSGRAKITPEVQYRVASVTKTFTAVLCLKLIEEGYFNLTDSLHKFVDVKGIDYGKRITILQLLSHTSGLIDHLNRADFYTGNWNHRTWDFNYMLRYTANRKSKFPPGTNYAYSNTGFYLLGTIIEKVTQMPLAEAYKKWIFDPLKLENTFYDISSTSSKPIKGLAKNGRSYEYHLTAVGAAGAIISTPTDIAKFGKKLYDGELLESASMKAMLKDYGSAFGDTQIGLGTRMWTDFGIFHYGHTGSLMGYRSVLIYIPDKKACFALSTNQSHKKWYDLVNNLLREFHIYF